MPATVFQWVEFKVEELEKWVGGEGEKMKIEKTGKTERMKNLMREKKVRWKIEKVECALLDFGEEKLN